MMVAAHPAILPAPIHFRYLERDSKSPEKGPGIRGTAGCDPRHEDRFGLVDRGDRKIQWQTPSDSALRPNSGDRRIQSRMGCLLSGGTNGGSVDPTEKQKHINYLELPAASLALRSFLPNRRKLNILLRIDNVTAIAFLNRMGGTHSQELSDLAVVIWEWCLEKKIILHAEHLPGKENVRGTGSHDMCGTPAIGCSREPPSSSY